MMQMLGLSVPSIIQNQANTFAKQESTHTVFLCICVSNLQVHSEKGSTASSNEDTGNDFSVKSNAPQMAKDGKQVGTRCVCYPFRMFLFIKMKGNQ